MEHTPTVYLAMKANYWAKGPTVEEAKTKLGEIAGSIGPSWGVWKMPDGSFDHWVDMMGNTNWTWAEGADRSGRPELVASKGIEA